ncbi:hypothetical protein [Thioalkalivibrio sp. ALJ16]|uniref:hypothetical protein n=1 Tax=Thioalkalivibrio sp. ALJ16 TaxID=1158762 RepID=UPI00037864DC|nr:hypothetical protein [Thioalkalivibrio sp. ALJ16]
MTHDRVVEAAVLEVATLGRSNLSAREYADALQDVANRMTLALAANPDPSRRDDPRPLAVLNVAACAEHAAQQARPRP